MSDHYFSPAPSGAEQRHTLSVRLGGRDVVVESAGGVFSHERLDPGTAVLLDAVGPPPPTGLLVDLGCGWGPIALDLALAAPDARVLAVDVNERARALTRDNARRLGLPGVVVADPDEGVRMAQDAGGIGLLRSNPPIRVGKESLHGMLRTWLALLAPGGRAELVVAKNLGADSLARWIGADLQRPCERLASAKGYRVLVVG